MWLDTAELISKGLCQFLLWLTVREHRALVLAPGEQVQFILLLLWMLQSSVSLILAFPYLKGKWASFHIFVGFFHCYLFLLLLYAANLECNSHNFLIVWFWFSISFQNQYMLCFQLNIYFCPSLISKFVDVFWILSFFILSILESTGFIIGSSV